MTLIKAMFLGIVQGLTEFLPVSSSGHLAIFKQLFNIGVSESGTSSITFDILLHIGTLIAIVLIYFKDIKKMIIEFCLMLRDCFSNFVLYLSRPFGKTDKQFRKIITGSYRKFVVMVIIATIPTAIIGLLLKNIVESVNSNIIIVGLCLLITSVSLLIAEISVSKKKTPRNIPYWQSALVGVAQGVATMPGISRSGATISCGLALGFDRRFAVKYSFIMSIPAVLGALVLDIKDIAGSSMSGQLWGYYIVGMVLAAAVGYVCIKVVNYLAREKKFRYFAYYCAIIGLISIIAGFIKK